MRPSHANLLAAFPHRGPFMFLPAPQIRWADAVLIRHSLVSLGRAIHNVLTAQVILASPLPSVTSCPRCCRPALFTARHCGAGARPALPRLIGALREQREEAPAWCCGVVREGRGVDEEQREEPTPFYPRERGKHSPEQRCHFHSLLSPLCWEILLCRVGSREAGQGWSKDRSLQQW